MNLVRVQVGTFRGNAQIKIVLARGPKTFTPIYAIGREVLQSALFSMKWLRSFAFTMQVRE
jgi:hypothetical protein